MRNIRLIYQIAALGMLCMTGCASTLNVQGIPAERVPTQFLGRSREAMQQLTISRLRQSKPEAYQLAPGDILGIYIEYVLGDPEEAPPVHFPEDGDQPPAIGFPFPVREDGTLALPLVEPINVEGLTLEQATQKIRTIYTDSEILQPGKDKVIVTIMRRREYRVLVIREESGGQAEVLKRGTGKTVDLPAYENDVLHALNETGGMPGLDAQNELLIIRGGAVDGADYDRFVAAVRNCQDPCDCPPIIGDSPDVTRIPIRFYPENVPNFSEEDVILESGDIVYIQSREAKRFYTGGVLGGGEHLIPRDYDIDILQAIAIAGGQLGMGQTGIAGGGRGGGGGGFGGGGGRGGGIGPSRLLIIRQNECDEEVVIKININEALTDPSKRLLVMPGDTLILQFTFAEELANALIGSFNFNFLLNQGN